MLENHEKCLNVSLVALSPCMNSSYLSTLKLSGLRNLVSFIFHIFVGQEFRWVPQGYSSLRSTVSGLQLHWREWLWAGTAGAGQVCLSICIWRLLVASLGFLMAWWMRGGRTSHIAAGFLQSDQSETLRGAASLHFCRVPLVTNKCQIPKEGLHKGVEPGGVDHWGSHLWRLSAHHDQSVAGKHRRSGDGDSSLPGMVTFF